MSEQKIDKFKKINKKLPKDIYDETGYMDLNNCYDQTVAELGLQQSKRDQIIAFYLTILGFVIPNVIQLPISELAKFAAFAAMYAIGMIFAHVVLRYRIYKEVYWIACRVITQMCNIKAESRNREVIYTLFFHCLDKNCNTIVRKNKKGKISLLCSFKRQLNSAETLLFETLVLFSTFVGVIGVFYLKEICIYGAILAGCILLFMLIRINYKYATRLMALYTCVETGNTEDLEKTFSKAWMLHCYVDDVIEENMEN